MATGLENLKLYQVAEKAELEVHELTKNIHRMKNIEVSIN
jgi:hypothetical protein